MSKLLRIPAEIKVVSHQTQFVLKAFIHKEALQDWCLGLCLLNEGLIEFLIVSDVRSEKSFKLNLKTGPEKDPRARIHSKSHATAVDLTANGLKYLLHFSLRYYRDGVADVDHVNIEAIDADSERDAYLTVSVADSVPPVSPEEAQRRLTGRR